MNVTQEIPKTLAHHVRRGTSFSRHEIRWQTKQTLTRRPRRLRWYLSLDSQTYKMWDPQAPPGTSFQEAERFSHLWCRLRERTRITCCWTTGGPLVICVGLLPLGTESVHYRPSSHSPVKFTIPSFCSDTDNDLDRQ